MKCTKLTTESLIIIPMSLICGISLWVSGTQKRRGTTFFVSLSSCSNMLCGDRCLNSPVLGWDPRQVPWLIFSNNDNPLVTLSHKIIIIVIKYPVPLNSQNSALYLKIIYISFCNSELTLEAFNGNEYSWPLHFCALYFYPSPALTIFSNPADQSRKRKED